MNTQDHKLQPEADGVLFSFNLDNDDESNTNLNMIECIQKCVLVLLCHIINGPIVLSIVI